MIEIGPQLASVLEVVAIVACATIATWIIWR